MSPEDQIQALQQAQTDDFADWLTELDQDVIQGEYGYEPGEFAVYPEVWVPMWREGLSPAAAFKRALDGYAELQREREAARIANYERIQAEDAALKQEAQANG